ncbi:MAG: TrkA family potassium uptake protein [Candidatus Omnitrophica bacterium]|nr:TrkA family potassium uptake protein [Candidatus Omnitrophota bacterium]
MYQALVIGLGTFGTALVSELVSKGGQVVVIDQNSGRSDPVKDLVERVIVADATNREVLAEYAKDIDCAIVAIGERVDSSILVTYLLKELGVRRIIAKAVSEEHGKILKVVGANDVVFPERDEARRLATSLISPDVLDFIKLSGDFSVVEIAVPERFVKQTIRGLDLRNKYGMQILAVKNALTGAVQIMPTPDYELQADDILVVIGEVSSLKQFR